VLVDLDGETDSEAAALNTGRQALLYMKTRDGKATGVPTNMFSPEDDTFVRGKGRLEHRIPKHNI